MAWWLTVILIVLILLVLYCAFPTVWTRGFGRSMRTTGMDGTVSLTFDDGPNPTYTPRLLDALKAHDIQATFFVLSERALQYRDIVERMIAEGHDVQVHGSRHWFVPFLHPLAARMQCVGAAKVLEQSFPLSVRVYRPTWGAANLASLFAVWRQRMILCTWNVMVGDWRVTEPDELVRRIVGKLQNQSVIVLHDSDHTFGAERGAPERVVQAIPGISDAVKSRGLRFVRICDCLGES
ncbi:polysaccharide deacetylase family protein [Alicyclobacillus fastidiosus]|uniref:Polysaccharide deacetylase family protein n=1 Tax=Alicyclobacillus fastidiosus TaxID=392011 RepID=A0ABY6ZMD3_9BACL|nr:polysaccharide deacetylase family protein [Alicyclobacillus fastidiosus]WAH43992.1 polysaccharide deacetylase family protein [Alicyclobacillus fastidiosus]GMA60268.1 polysaccharide deacetylase familiy protein [Alicyclobacillus fastidiosus]